MYSQNFSSLPRVGDCVANPGLKDTTPLALKPHASSLNTRRPEAPALPTVFAAAALAITLLFASAGCGKTEPYQPPSNQPLSSAVYSYAVLEQPALLKEFEDNQRLSESLQAALATMKTEIEKTGQKAESVDVYKKQTASLKMINDRLADIRTKLVAAYGNAMRDDTIPADLQEKLQQMETDAEAAKRAAQKQQQGKASGKTGAPPPPPEPLVLKPSGGLPATVGEADKAGGTTIKPTDSGTSINIKTDPKRK